MTTRKEPIVITWNGYVAEEWDLAASDAPESDGEDLDRQLPVSVDLERSEPKVTAEIPHHQLVTSVIARAEWSHQNPMSPAALEDFADSFYDLGMADEARGRTALAVGCIRNAMSLYGVVNVTKQEKCREILARLVPHQMTPSEVK